MRSTLFCLCLLLLSGCGSGSGEERPPPYLVVVNRGAESISVIDPGTDAVVQTVLLPRGANPLIPGYVVYSPIHNRVYVGDEANARVIVLRGYDFGHVGDLPMPADAFHMWRNDEQLWVVDRKDFSVAVFALDTSSRLTVIPIPADLRAKNGAPHDVVVDDGFAYVTVANVFGVPDVVVKYSTRTFAEVGRVSVGDDPHVFLHPTNRRLYVACQDTDDVHVVDRDTLAVETVIASLGGHGVWVPPHGRALYVTNFPSHVEGGAPGPNADGLFTINLDTHTDLGGITTPFPRPHNIASTADGRKLYVTHTNSDTKVSVYAVDDPGAVPTFLREINVDKTPFGICRLE